MSGLRFYLFGNHCVARFGAEGQEIKLLPAARGLLAYLLIHRQQRHSREALADAFWSHDAEHARGCLRTALWRLRRDLEGQGPAGWLLAGADGEIGLNPNGYWLDIAAFESGLAHGLARPALDGDEAAALEDACRLYAGDLLQALYDDWAIRERERLRLLYIRGLSALLTYYRQEKLHEAGLDCAERILALDPLREEVHRDMMRLYAGLGQRSQALQQYGRCRQALEDELGARPMAETTALYRRLLAGEEATLPAPPPARPATVQQALRHLQRTAHSLEQAQGHFRHALDTLARLLDGDELTPDP
jgi:DNA-binding SARP family transcriptional activator